MRIHTRSNRRIFNPNSEFRIPNSRQGLSLAEVLIALFVLAIGMMGILSLFPLGAAQMAQAVKDERSAQLADIADGMFRIYWRDAYIKSNGTMRTDQEVFQNYPELQGMDVPAAPPTTYQSGIENQAVLKSSAPSSPLYIDPIGYGTGTTTSQKTWVANTANVLPRRSISPIEKDLAGLPAIQTAARIRFCGLMDDMSFNSQGLANPVNRGNRFNCAGVLQRSKNNVRHEANLKVVVYKDRPPADTPPFEVVISSSVNVNLTAIDTLPSITLPAGMPNLRKGAWILLASQQTPAPPAVPTVEAFADFYRIVGVSQTSNTQFTLQVSPPLRRHVITGNTYLANVFYLDNVVEVFDRGTISPYEVAGN